jgi:hypothetical protein
MDNNFYDRQRQVDQDHERQKSKLQKHATMETWGIEQGEAHQGNIPSSEGADVVPPKPGLLGRLRKLFTGRS